ncbi:MAG: hypothetical protein ACOC38_04005 [Promethearchaeia archaeon]
MTIREVKKSEDGYILENMVVLCRQTHTEIMRLDWLVHTSFLGHIRSRLNLG